MYVEEQQVFVDADFAVGVPAGAAHSPHNIVQAQRANIVVFLVVDVLHRDVLQGQLPLRRLLHLLALVPALRLLVASTVDGLLSAWLPTALLCWLHVLLGFLAFFLGHLGRPCPPHLEL